jgi:hypothetical protein
VTGCQNGSAVDCGDSVACTVDACNESTDSCNHLADDSACDDALFCNGAESCDAADGCHRGTAIDCGDGVACTHDACDEAGDSCDHTPDDSACSDGLYCNGTETCDVLSGCQAGAAPVCTDIIDCTTDSCDEAADSCAHLPNDGACNDGLFCNGTESCNVAAGCQSGPAIDCGDGVACTTDDCEESTDSCSHLANDSACDDGEYCNGTESCDAEAGCKGGAAPSCSDPVDCTTDACNETTDSCDHTPNDSACSDDLFCNGAEVCDALSGCRAGPIPHCTDVIDCTADACDEDLDSCTHATNDSVCDDGVYCNGGEICDVATGCRPGPPRDCADDFACTTDSCDEDSDSCAHAADDSACDDHQYCNGTEVCDVAAGCRAGTAPSCADTVDCTTDACDEESDSCTHSANDAACDDHQHCNGVETCNVTAGCAAGTAPDCKDDVGCTTDACNEDTDACDNLPDDAGCDDNLFCNGAETCDPVADCQPGTAPDCKDAVECTVDYCNEAAGACAHAPNHSVCHDGSFCDGQEKCDPASGCKPGETPACDDGVSCTTDTCDTETDSCAHVANDSACNDGLYCNGIETCNAQTDCVSGVSVACLPSSEQCTRNECNETSHECGVVPADDGGVCDDADVCTTEDACAGGDCVGQPLCNEPCERCNEGACVDLCGLPYSLAAPPNVLDGLYILRAAVGLDACPLCQCDVNDSKRITALDGILVVRKALGLSAELTCAVDEHVVTTTTTTTKTAPNTTSTTL